MRPRLPHALLLLVACNATTAVTTAESESGASEHAATASDAAMTEASSSDSDASGSGTAGGTTTATTATTETSESDPSGTFVMEPDLPPGATPCGVNLQGCAPGEKCASVDPWGYSTNPLGPDLGCVPLDPDPVGPGEPCSTGALPGDGVDSCAAGSYCQLETDDGAGTCVPYCYPDEDGYGGEYYCHVDGYACVPPPCQSCVLGFCVLPCDPTAEVSCDPGEVCVADFSSDFFFCTFDASGDDGADGDSCDFVNSCDFGLACAFGGDLVDCADDWCCTPFCVIGMGSCAAPEEACVPYFEPGTAPPGLEHVGLCQLP
ncbi:MAG: hypothetical protein R3A51_13315 [Nannocystaceae bacterium]